MGNYSFDYPAILTNKDWQKSKGLAAKLFVGKTDVGPALTALEQEVKGSDFGKVTAFAGKDVLGFNQYLANVTAGLGKAGSAIAAKAQAADLIASAAYDKAKDTKLAPKAVAAHLDHIIDALVALKADVKKYQDHVEAELKKDFEKALATNPGVVALLSIADGAIGKNYLKFVADIKAVSKTPSIAEFTTVFGANNSARYVCTNYNTWNAFTQAMPGLAKKIYNGNPAAAFTSPEMQDTADLKAEAKMRSAVDGGRPEGMVVTEYLNSLIAASKHVQTYDGYVKAARKALDGALDA